MRLFYLIKSSVQMGSSSSSPKHVKVYYKVSYSTRRKSKIIRKVGGALAAKGSHSGNSITKTTTMESKDLISDDDKDTEVKMTHIVQRPCSLDNSFEQVDIIPSKLPPSPWTSLNTADILVTSRTDPLTPEQFEAMLDGDGRLVNEHLLRKAVFLGGVCPSIRREVWSFLFGLYPCNSTAREREAIKLENIVKYHEMKSRWKKILIATAPPTMSSLEQGLTATYEQPTPQASTSSPFSSSSSSSSSSRDPASSASTVSSSSPPPPSSSSSRSSSSSSMETINPQQHNQFNDISYCQDHLNLSALGHPELEEECAQAGMAQRIQFMQIQAQVQVNRKKIDARALRSNIRVIDKDVPRTDRGFEFYSGAGNPQLSILRDVLITSSAYNDNLGYAQGMNDILSRFLYVMGSEVETFWCFQTYMETIREDFMEAGMTYKIELVRNLLAEMDPDLLRHLELNDLGNMFFCHRWLLLGFKREFSFLDSLRCFEILSSHHLELSSMEAEKAVWKEEQKEFANTEGDSRSTNIASQKDYTFEVFMCATILIECRDDLLELTDTGQVFSYVNSIKFDLDNLLTKSERMFFIYCKKTVTESFQLVDREPARQKTGLFSFLS